MTQTDRDTPVTTHEHPLDDETCPLSQRADGHHSWRFDGDDPYVVCVYCDERRDAISGCIR